MVGIVREVDDQQLRPRHQVPAGVVDVGQQLRAVGDFQQDGVGGRHRHGVQMGRIGRGRHNRRVARPHQRQAHVAEPLLRSQAGDHLALRIEPDAVLLEVLGGHLAPQAEDALGGRIAVVLRVAGGLGQLLDHQVLRRVAGIAHPQVDHVGARPALLVHQLVDLARTDTAAAGEPARPLRS